MEVWVANGGSPGTITQVPQTKNFPKIWSRSGKCKNTPQGCSVVHESSTDSPFAVISIMKSLQEERKEERREGRGGEGKEGKGRGEERRGEEKRNKMKRQKVANHNRVDGWENLHLKD